MHTLETLLAATLLILLTALGVGAIHALSLHATAQDAAWRASRAAALASVETDDIEVVEDAARTAAAGALATGEQSVAAWAARRALTAPLLDLDLYRFDGETAEPLDEAGSLCGAAAVAVITLRPSRLFPDLRVLGTSPTPTCRTTP